MDANARRTLLELLYHDTLRQLQPSTVLRDAIAERGREFIVTSPLHCIALGKASVAMTISMLDWCRINQQPVVGGICVTHDAEAAVPSPIACTCGDHPTPGAQSAAASRKLGEYIATAVQTGDHVAVLLSGGTSALIGSPRAGIDASVFAQCNDALLGGGISIDAINAVRRLLSRWGDGRLGNAIQDRGATAEVFVISDVLDGDVGVVGSGPCKADALSAPHSQGARAQIERSPTLSATLRDALAIAATADSADRSVHVRAPIPHRIVSDSVQATQVLAALARERGLAARVFAKPLVDDVATCALRVAHELIETQTSRQLRSDSAQPTLLIWRGEPTVTLPMDGAPRGGRMQALALAVARALDAAGTMARGISLLAAGTDGRDGPTDAAGAVISESTWREILAAGRSPDDDIAAWNSLLALRSVGALIPAFTSGTNVNDVMIGVID